MRSLTYACVRPGAVPPSASEPCGSVPGGCKETDVPGLLELMATIHRCLPSAQLHLNFPQPLS